MKLGKLGEILKIAKKTYEKHDRLILTAITIGGTLYAVYRAAKDGPKYREILDQCDEEGVDTVEKVKRLAPAVAPVAVATGVSVIAAVANFKVAGDAIKGLADAYTVAKTGKEVFEDCTEKIVGPEKTEEIRKEVAKVQTGVANSGGAFAKPIATGHGNDLMFDAWSGRYFYSDINYVKKCVNDLNAQMINDMYISLNEYYAYQDLPGIGAGRDLGWNIDYGTIEINITSELDECDRPYTYISFINKPICRYGSGGRY